MRSENERSWKPFQQCIYDERIAIMREANNIPESMETPAPILDIAFKQASGASTAAETMKRCKNLSVLKD